MSFVLINHGRAGQGLGVPQDPRVVGKYLAWFDVDAFDGRGSDHWTDNLADAIRFPSFVAAMAAWKTTSRVRPVREDGRPNRPLTAYSVEPRHIDD